MKKREIRMQIIRNELVDSISKLLQELLIIFLRNSKQLVDELLSIVIIEIPDINLLVHHLMITILMNSGVHNGFYDTSSQPGVSWQSLKRSPSQGFFIFHRVDSLSPRSGVAATKHFLHPPAHAPAAAPVSALGPSQSTPRSVCVHLL